MSLIDVHSHIVPRSLPDNPAPDSERRWPCVCHNGAGDATVMIDDEPFREIDHRSWESVSGVVVNIP